MFRNKVVITFFSVLLFICGLFLLYTSNINKTLFVDISAEHPFLIEDNQGKGMIIKKNSEEKYTVLLPSNFFYQSNTIYIKNIDNEKINLKLYTEQKKDGDKEIEFSINIKNIKINGQNYNNKKQTVWYERPYIDTVSVNKDEVVSFGLKYKTKLILRNIYIPQLALSIVLLLASIFLLWKFYYGAIIKLFQNICLHIEKYGEWDMLIIQKYRDIDVVYKKTFWTVFIVLNLVFLYYNIHFIWGNHDWDYVMHGMWGDIIPPVVRKNGRFSAYWIQQFLGGRFLPLITVSFMLLGFSLTGILLAHYWKVQKTFFNYLVISLIIVLNPLVVYWIYFAINVVSNLWLPSIMILALILSEKKSHGYFFLACLLFLLGLGIYQPAVSTIIVIFLGKIVLTYCFEKQSIIFLYQKFKRTFGCVIISLIFFRLVFYILSVSNVLLPCYNTDTKFLGGSFSLFYKIVRASFENLILTVPFYDINIIILFFMLCFISFISFCLYYKKRYQIKFFQLFFIIIGLCLLPLAANTATFILGRNFAYERVLFFGYIFLGAFWVVMILKTKFIWAKNILITFLIVLIPMNIYRIVDAQKLWKMEFEYQNRIIERVVENISNSPYCYQNQYKIVFLGEYKPFVLSFYKERFDFLDYSFISTSSFVYWVFPSVIKIFIPNFKCERVLQLNYVGMKEKETNKAIIELLPYYDLLKNMRLLPSINAILVQDNYIFINFDDEVLQKVLKSMEEIKLTELQ